MAGSLEAAPFLRRGGWRNALRLVMTDFMDGNNDGSIGGMLAYLTEEVTDELMTAYPDIIPISEIACQIR